MIQEFIKLIDGYCRVTLFRQILIQKDKINEISKILRVHQEGT